jgi:TonB family protein
MKMSAQTMVLAICLILISPLAWVRAQGESPLSDENIKVVSFEELKYPALARSARIQGALVVRVRLDDQGKVMEAAAVSGHELLAISCVTNAKKWRFEPNKRKAVVIIYNFTIIDGRCNSDSSLFILQGPNLATIITCPPKINTSSTR